MVEEVYDMDDENLTGILVLAFALPRCDALSS
jgi:hypothetical protein